MNQQNVNQLSFSFASSPAYVLYRLADMRRGLAPLLPAIFSIFDDGEDDAASDDETRVERTAVKLGIS